VRPSAAATATLAIVACGSRSIIGGPCEGLLKDRRPNTSNAVSVDPWRLLWGGGALALVTGVVSGLTVPTRVVVDYAVGPLLGAGAGIACGIWALGSASLRSLDWWLSSRRRSKTVLGKVIGRSTDQQPSDYAYVYQRVLTVAYQVDRRARELRWTPSSVYSNGSSIMNRIDRKYPDGTEVTVRFEPGHPENAGVGRLRLPPFLASSLLALFVGGVFATAFIATSACAIGLGD
jgi:hypothetical protein